MTDNRELAARCRATADELSTDPLARRGALCCSVALATTGTVWAARQALAGVRPEDVRDAALRLFGRIAMEESSER